MGGKIFSQVFVNVIVDASLLALLAYGMGVRVRSAKVYDFSYFSMFLLGGYLAWGVMTLIGANIFIATILVIAIVGILALTIDVWIYRKALKLRHRVEVMIASLGVFVVVENVLSLVVGPDVKILNQSPIDVYKFDSVGVTVSETQLIQFVVSSIVLMSLIFVQQKTNWGLRFRATESNNELALVLGLQPWRLVSEAQLCCGAVAALCGVLFAMDRDLVPEMALSPMLHVTIAIVLGGLGRAAGPIVGAFVVTSIWHITGVYFDTQWQNISIFIALLAVLLISPKGMTSILAGNSRDT